MKHHIWYFSVENKYIHCHFCECRNTKNSNYCFGIHIEAICTLVDSSEMFEIFIKGHLNGIEVENL